MNTYGLPKEWPEDPWDAIALAQSALHHYARHERWCAQRRWFGRDACDCGLAEIRTRIYLLLSKQEIGYLSRDVHGWSYRPGERPPTMAEARAMVEKAKADEAWRAAHRRGE